MDDTANVITLRSPEAFIGDLAFPAMRSFTDGRKSSAPMQHPGTYHQDSPAGEPWNALIMATQPSLRPALEYQADLQESGKTLLTAGSTTERVEIAAASRIVTHVIRRGLRASRTTGHPRLDHAVAQGRQAYFGTEMVRERLKAKARNQLARWPEASRSLRRERVSEFGSLPMSLLHPARR